MRAVFAALGIPSESTWSALSSATILSVSAHCKPVFGSRLLFTLTCTWADYRHESGSKNAFSSSPFALVAWYESHNRGLSTDTSTAANTLHTAVLKLFAQWYIYISLGKCFFRGSGWSRSHGTSAKIGFFGVLWRPKLMKSSDMAAERFFGYMQACLPTLGSGVLRFAVFRTLTVIHISRCSRELRAWKFQGRCAHAMSYSLQSLACTGIGAISNAVWISNANALLIEPTRY